jgi:hypothetical protein
MVRERLQETKVQVSLAVLTLVLFVAIFVTVMLLNAPGPFQRLVSTLNGAEGCVSIITRSQTAQEAAFTPVPLGLARSAQQRTEVLCTVAGSDITFFAFGNENALHRAVDAYPAVAESHACTYSQRYLIVDDGPWDANERFYLLRICNELHGQRLGSKSVWRRVPD